MLLVCLFFSIPFSGCSTLENHFIYSPAVYPDGWNEIDNEEIEQAWFFADDGAALHGLFVEQPQAKAVLLFAHGRVGNVTDNMDTLLKLSLIHI